MKEVTQFYIMEMIAFVGMIVFEFDELINRLIAHDIWSAVRNTIALIVLIIITVLVKKKVKL